MSVAPTSDIPIHRPKPRRPFEITPESPTSPDSTDAPAWPGKLENVGGSAGVSGTTTPARTRSILNLTASTLFGIYQPDEDATPYGSGAQTPLDSRHNSFDHRQGSFDFTRSARFPENITLSGSGSGSNGHAKRSSLQLQQQEQQEQMARQRQRAAAIAAANARQQRPFRTRALAACGRALALLAIGVLYGLLVSHLHDHQKLAPVPLDIDRRSWVYLAFWGGAGVLFGEALPWVDSSLASRQVDDGRTTTETEDEDARRGSTTAGKASSSPPPPAPEPRREPKRGSRGWPEVVRAVGAFVGIAFAIRRLPWQSTLQLSLTLALANPALWYLIDRTARGFAFCSVVAIAGTTALLLALGPEVVPRPPSSAAAGSLPGSAAAGLHNATAELASANGQQSPLVLGVFTQETVGVWTWLASVLFVSAVCFGNIGRQLTPSAPRR